MVKLQQVVLLNQAFGNQDPAAAAWNEVLMSANVKGELNNQKVKVPGFIVPVEYDADQNVTAFFLVPYFGAWYSRTATTTKPDYFCH